MYTIATINQPRHPIKTLEIANWAWLISEPKSFRRLHHLQGMRILQTALPSKARERHWLLPHQPGPSRLQLSFCPSSAPTPLPPLSGHSPTFPEDFGLGLQIAFPFFPLHVILSNFTCCDGASGILTLQLLPTSWWPSSLLPISTWSHGLHQKHPLLWDLHSKSPPLLLLCCGSRARSPPPPPHPLGPALLTTFWLLLFLDPASTCGKCLQYFSC